MKLYVLKNSDEPVTNFVVCSMKADSPWFYLCWSLGRPFDEKLPVPIIYYTDRKGEIQDYPLTNSDQFLVSSQFYDVIISSGAKFDSFDSKVVLTDNSELNNFFTLNFVESYSAIDRQRSDCEEDPDFPETRVYQINKLVLKSDLIPNNKGIFRLGENESVIIVTENLKNKIKQLNLTGIKLIEIEVS